MANAPQAYQPYKSATQRGTIRINKAGNIKTKIMKRMIPSYLRQCDKCEQRKERIEELYEQLTAKDTTIKEQTEKIERLTGLLKDEVYKNAFTYWVKQDCTEDAAKHAAHKTLNDFKEQHGI